MVALLARLLAAGTAGIAAGLAFEPTAWWFLLPFSVAGLTLVVQGTRTRTAFGIGLVYGLAFMLVLIPWVTVIGPDAWVGLSVLEAVFFGLLGAGLSAVRALPWWPVLAAAWWVAVEALRSVVPWGGFPWGRLAFATVDTPAAPTMTYVGSAGTTFVVALLGTSLAYFLIQVRRRPLAAIVAPASAACLAVAATVLPFDTPTDEAHPIKLAMVQGNVPGEGMDAFSERRAVLNNHVSATHDLADRVSSGQSPGPDFVLWPENSTDIDPFADDTVFRDIQQAVDDVGVPILVGAMVGGPGVHDVRNQGIVWNPTTGPGETYSKTHPVPFGEYIPMRAQLASIFERLDQIPRDMVPGTEPGLLHIDGHDIGDVICFEVAYDGLIRDVVRGGAELLVVQTNNATYMNTGQVEQQFAIARLRALETGRHVAVVATNGVSGLVGPDGEVIRRAPTRTQSVIEHQVATATQLTPAMRYGKWVELGLVGIGLLAVLAAGLLARRRAGRPNTGTEGSEQDAEDTKDAEDAEDDSAAARAGTS